MASTAATIRDYHTQLPGAIVDDRYEFPVVTTTNARGKKSTWQVAVYAWQDLPDNIVPVTQPMLDNVSASAPTGAKIVVESRQVGSAAFRATTPTIVSVGKNLGRKHATTAFCQALRDAYSMWTKQGKKSTDRVDVGAKRVLPMLAQVLSAQTVKPDPPIWVSYKFDGLRGVITLDGDTPIAYSRKGILYPPQPHIFSELKPVLDWYASRSIKIYLDGEFYAHGVKLQDISGRMRNAAMAAQPDIWFQVYDAYFESDDPALNSSTKFAARLAELQSGMSAFWTQYSRLVEHTKCDTYDCVDTIYKRALAEGYEGAMCRLDAAYEPSYNDYHSKVLLKIKPRLDGEYTVVGWTTGRKGKAANALMIICEHAGKEFPVTPAMTLLERNELAESMNREVSPGVTYFDATYRGKKIIVEFDDLSKDGLPQRASTKLEFRVEEPVGEPTVQTG
jgi:ATP-dependent DNA ligase